ncbi:MAG: hypothetical protein ABEH78_05380 [Haloferacaceae archaeon]
MAATSPRLGIDHVTVVPDDPNRPGDTDRDDDADADGHSGGREAPDDGES